MAYKYKESIKDAVNEVYSASFADELNRKNELEEVYRKAEAFDRLYAEFDKGDKDLSKADFDEVYQEEK